MHFRRPVEYKLWLDLVGANERTLAAFRTEKYHQIEAFVNFVTN